MMMTIIIILTLSKYNPDGVLLLPTQIHSVRVSRIFESVCLSVCLSAE